MDAAAKRLAEWFGYSWEYLYEGNVRDRTNGTITNPWCWRHGRNFQGGKQDVRDIVEEIVRLHGKDTQG